MKSHIWILCSFLPLLCNVSANAEENGALVKLDFGQLLDAQVDFTFDRGSYTLLYSAGDKPVYSVIIQGPEGPEEPDAELDIEVLHSSTPLKRDSYRPMEVDETKRLVHERVSSGQVLAKEESSFLVVLLIHHQDIARIKNWGFGVSSVIKGDWVDAFHEPTSELVFPSHKDVLSSESDAVLSKNSGDPQDR